MPSWLNKFIAFFVMTSMMCLGALAIHSIKVDTIPVDMALGLIARKADPAFTLKAKAQCSTGPCATEPTLQALNALTTSIEAARQAVSSAIGGIIAIIKATIKAIMKILQMIKKIFSFFISLIQKFAGQDLSLYGILASVRELSTIGNSFNGMFKSIQSEFDNIGKEFNQDVAKATENIQKAGQSASQVSDMWYNCVFLDVAMDEGLSPYDNATVDDYCDIAVESAAALQTNLSIGTASSGAASDLFSISNQASAPGTTGSTNSSSGSSGTTFSTSSSVTITPYTAPLNLLFTQDKDTTAYNYLGTRAQLEADKQKAKEVKDKKEEQAKKAQAWAPDCGTYVGKNEEQSKATQEKYSLTPSQGDLFKIDPTKTIQGTPSFTTLTTNGQISGATLNSSNGTSQSTSNLNYGLAKIDGYQLSSFTPEQCSYAKDAAKTVDESVANANNTTQPAESSGGIQAVIDAMQAIFDLIAAVQEIFQTIMGFINELMQIGQSFASEFQSFFGSMGSLFNQSGSGNVLGVSDALASNITLTPTIGSDLANSQPVDTNGTTINDGVFLTDQNKIKQYSDQSLDCVLDSVKIGSTAKTAEYAGANFTLTQDNIPQVGKNNIKTYTNGSNVPDSIMGATVTDANTPPMSGLTYKKPTGETGNVPPTPSKSLITSGSATNNPNSTYHTCQSSPWGDDNSVETASKRLAYYPADPKYGGPSANRDGVSNDWRVVNNVMSKDIPEQCYLTNNDLSNEEKQSIISQLGIQGSLITTTPTTTTTGGRGGTTTTSTTTSINEQLWQQAKGQIDDAQRNGRVRWDPDPLLAYQNRVRGGVIVGDGTNKKEVQIKAGRCEVAYSKTDVENALNARGWSFNRPEVKSFVQLVP